MKPYPDRQTAAILRNFSIGIDSRTNFRQFENMEARLFQRTLNEPCSYSVRAHYSMNAPAANSHSELLPMHRVFECQK